MTEEPVLCYVDEPWAFFTTQALDKQWGDDWNDAPYEHNAGWPYHWVDGRDGEPWQIVKVAYEADLYEAVPESAEFTTAPLVDKIAAEPA